MLPAVLVDLVIPATLAVPATPAVLAALVLPATLAAPVVAAVVALDVAVPIRQASGLVLMMLIPKLMPRLRTCRYSMKIQLQQVYLLNLLH